MKVKQKVKQKGGEKPRKLPKLASKWQRRGSNPRPRAYESRSLK